MFQASLVGSKVPHLTILSGQGNNSLASSLAVCIRPFFYSGSGMEVSGWKSTHTDGFHRNPSRRICSCVMCFHAVLVSWSASEIIQKKWIGK